MNENAAIRLLRQLFVIAGCLWCGVIVGPHMERSDGWGERIGVLAIAAVFGMFIGVASRLLFREAA